MRNAESIHLSGESPDHDYRFFRDPEERAELYQYSKGLARQVRERGVTDIVFVDRAARPIFVGLREYWRSKFPEEKLPGIFFINPAGFNSHEHPALNRPDEFDEFLPDIPINQCVKDGSNDIRPEADIVAEFKQIHRYLMDHRQQPILLFDTCIHSGATIKSVVDTMRQLGFTNLVIGTIHQPINNQAFVQPDFWAASHRSVGGCSPFGQDRSIEKTCDHVISTPTNDPDIRSESVELRDEIRRVIAEELEHEQCG
jgi:hypothetical protein